VAELTTTERDGFDEAPPVARRPILRTVAACCALAVVLAGCPDNTTATKTTTPASVAATPQITLPGGERNPGDAYSSYGVYERVNFPSGTTGTTISSAVVRGSVNGYLFGADAGQKFILNLVSPNASFDVYAPDDTVIARDSRYLSFAPLPAKGDYLVVVSSQFGNAGFELLTEITGATAKPSVPAKCESYVEFNGDYPMRQCHKGAEVRAVQQKLKDAGYQLSVDGFFGPGTANVLQQKFVDGSAVLNEADVKAL